MGDKQRTSVAFEPFVRLRDEDNTEVVYYSLLCEDIPEDFKEVAFEELNETEENKRMGISKLRDFLEELNIADVDDHILLTVLRNCKFQIKNSEKKLMNFLKIINSTIEGLQKVDMKRLESVLENRVVGLLPYRDKYGRFIMYTTAYGINFDLFNLDEAVLCAFCLLLYALSFPLTTVTGVACIVECNYLSLSTVFPVIKIYAQNTSTFMQFPVRIKRIDIFKEFSIIKWGYNVIRHLLPSKVKKRIQFYGSEIQNLQKFYHPSILPEELGGNMSPTAAEHMKEDILNFIQKLKSRKQFNVK